MWAIGAADRREGHEIFLQGLPAGPARDTYMDDARIGPRGRGQTRQRARPCRPVPFHASPLEILK
ncbi:hypothetical protein [Glycocaulis sp.]|uniref:hypothetical protein n=1 Tax=Glycocaulis sp. TaxID=1969725 RepID=UPI003D237F29